MPLTNAEKQKAWRRNRADKIARYEAALSRIAHSLHANEYAANVALAALSGADAAVER